MWATETSPKIINVGFPLSYRDRFPKERKLLACTHRSLGLEPIIQLAETFEEMSRELEELSETLAYLSQHLEELSRELEEVSETPACLSEHLEELSRELEKSSEALACLSERLED